MQKPTVLFNNSTSMVQLNHREECKYLKMYYLIHETKEPVILSCGGIGGFSYDKKSCYVIPPNMCDLFAALPIRLQNFF